MNFSLKKCFHGIFLRTTKLAFYSFVLLIAGSSLVSCTSTKPITYFSDISDSQIVRLPQMARPEQAIMRDDILEIKISGINEETVQMINSFGSLSAGGLTVGAPVYMVDANGEIEFPYVGKIKAEGLTREELKNQLKKKLDVYLKDAMVAVRFSNFRFTVLGEVRLPGSFNLQTDKVTVLEALGQAGDMTQYAVKKDVRVVRDSSGHRMIGKMDFTQKDLFTSPFYYLQRNDVVYVEANKNKTRNEQFGRVSALVATFTSIVAIAITIFKK